MRLEVKKDEDWIVIRIVDNGTGFDPEALEEFERFKHKSDTTFYEPAGGRKVGLKNVYLRLRILFGDKLDFAIRSVEGEGTAITIRFPAIPAK